MGDEREHHSEHYKSLSSVCRYHLQLYDLPVRPMTGFYPHVYLLHLCIRTAWVSLRGHVYCLH